MLMGDFGGTRDGKDGEIRVGTGKFTERPTSRRGAATSVFCRGYADNKGLSLAPQVGFEPTASRLTAESWLALVINAIDCAIALTAIHLRHRTGQALIDAAAVSTTVRACRDCFRA